jgi:co-chaperonin GroES (HSP10)
MRISRVLHDNLVVKIKRQPTELKTKSGLYITGIEQDFYIAEVILTGPGKWDINKETGKEEFYPVVIKPGDVVVLEKNFHHIYDARHRDRIDHTIEVEQGQDEYDYYLTKAEDCYLKFENPEAAKDAEVYGELYSVMAVREAVARV